MEVILCYGGAGRGATQIEVRASEMRGKRRRCSRISGATGQRTCADERVGNRSRLVFGNVSKCKITGTWRA